MLTHRTSLACSADDSDSVLNEGREVFPFGDEGNLRLLRILGLFGSVLFVWSEDAEDCAGDAP